jgi:iron complex outermembrane receptor protein
MLILVSAAWPRPASGQEPSAAPAETQPSASQPVVAGSKTHELEDVELLQMEVPVVVTASRREQKITSVPYAMSVITAEDIRRSGARNVPDALRLVPGVDVADLTHGAAAVAPRGFSGFVSRQVLVLVDGRQIFDSLFGGTLWGSWPFQLEDIARIEVIRGPAGVVWGANAVNGVINIITKDPADQAGLTFAGGGGTRGTHKEHLGYAFADEKLRLRVSGEYEGSDGFLRGGSFLKGLDDFYKGGRMGVHAIYKAGPDDTVLFSGGSGIVDGAYPRSPLTGFRGRRPGSEANFVLGRWTHRVAEDNEYEFTGYVNDFSASPGARQIDYRYQQLALQFGHTFKPASTHTLRWGADTRMDLLDGSHADPFMLSKPYVTSGTVGLYIQDEWRFAPRWLLNLGGRVDYDTYGGFQPSARAALVHEFNKDHSLYGAVSRAFQMPPAGLRFLDIPMLEDVARARGHQDLKPQPLLAYELGYRSRFWDRLDLNLNLFWNEYSDTTTLSPRLGPPTLLRMDVYNRARATIAGAELDARYALSKHLTLLGHYTYQELDWDSTAALHETESVSPPRHKFMLGARYSPTSDLHFSTHAYWVDAVGAPNPWNPFVTKQIDPYCRLDLRAEYEFCNKRASVAVGVRNLLDAHHFEGATLFLNDAEVPRMIYAEFRVTFK